MAHKEEEYTDYSCSTSLERLARDVETILRAWHVDRGSDRHVTVPSGSAAASVNAANASCIGSTESVGTAEDTAVTLATTASHAPPFSALIRNNAIAWTVATTDTRGQRVSVTVDLELALWDAPETFAEHGDRRDPVNEDGDDDCTASTGTTDGSAAPWNPEQTSAKKNNQRRRWISHRSPGDVADDGYDTDDSVDEPLVKSLQRSPFVHMPWHNCLFDNLSTLFGIGQHITLTPIHPQPVSPVLVDAIGNSVLRRHEEEHIAPIVVGSVLANWLQNSLNIATSNALCCIPAFGIWGQYRPNTLTTDVPSTTISLSAGSYSNNNNSNHNNNNSASVKSKHASSSPGRPQSSSQDGMSVASVASSVMAAHIADRIGISGRRIQVFPHWAQAIRQTKLPIVTRKYRNRVHTKWNKRFCPPLVSGNVIAPPRFDIPSVTANFTCTVTTIDHNTSTNSSLSTWGNVLLNHCPPDERVVMLCGARHVFGWLKRQKPLRLPSIFSMRIDDEALAEARQWRSASQAEANEPLGNVEQYREECRRIALELLEKAWTNKDDIEPLWGPEDDPVRRVFATSTWNGRNTGDGIVTPLMSLPMKIRSEQELSPADRLEMEESMERTVLNPLDPTLFCVQVFYDRDISVTPLTASQRCAVAALIRSATLPGETLIQHLIDEDLVDRWDNNAGTLVAMRLSDRAHVSGATRQIVKVMDWASIIDDMIDIEDAEAIVHDVMSGRLNAGFPDSPGELFLDDNDTFYALFRKSAPWGRLLSILFAHMARLRSISSMSLVWTVFVHELRRRWESRESVPNMRYNSALDPHPLTLYERRCFSTIGHKANFSAFLHCVEPDPDDFHCLIGQKLQVLNLGVECIVASEIAEHEAMERFLGTGELRLSQLLDAESASDKRGTDNETDTSSDGEQEQLSASEEDEAGTTHDTHLAEPNSAEDEPSSHGKNKPKTKWPKAKQRGPQPDRNRNYGPPSIDTDLEFWVMDEPGYAANLDVGLDFVEPPKISDDFDFAAPPPDNLNEVNPLSGEPVGNNEPSSNIGRSNSFSSLANGNNSNKFVVENMPDGADAWEGTIMHGSVDGSNESVVTGGTLSQIYYDAAEAGSIFSMKNEFASLNTDVNVEEMQKRPGARCPVFGINLEADDQLYAPYLQRPFPLTDDVVLERKLMLMRNIESSSNALHCRLELAQRLQRPKLMSDMRSFKAANPKATFQDFVNWYGNPGSPLDDYNDAHVLPGLTVEAAMKESAAKKFDRANEAMKVLNATRDFWMDCWKKAKPVPASEQDPLFDVASTVEMTLDYLEQMHPTNLLNQVVAVNLSSAYFTVVTSAKDALRIDAVERCLAELRKRIEHALTLLSRDASNGSTALRLNEAVKESSSSQRYASDETIAACDVACTGLAEAETLISRAVSLLHKFPKEYRLVQILLKSPDGTPIMLKDERERRLVLDAMDSRQEHGLPEPILREYVLRNLDDDVPCQLSVRYSNGESVEGMEGGLVLAVTRSYQDL